MYLLEETAASATNALCFCECGVDLGKMTAMNLLSYFLFKLLELWDFSITCWWKKLRTIEKFCP